MKRIYLFAVLLALLSFNTLIAQSPNDFVTTWQTDNPGTSNSTSITIPTTGGGYNYDVDWDNDGTFDELGITGDVTHDFGFPGTYIIRIQGTFPRIYFNAGGDAEKLLSVEQWGNMVWTSMSGAFAGCTNLQINATDTPDLSNVTSTYQMFYNCTFLSTGNFNSWDVSNVTNMEFMFGNCSSFNQPLNNWNVSNVTAMAAMFWASSLFNQLLDNWDVSSVTDMQNLLRSCSSFNQSLGSWDVSSVTNMSDMFNDVTLSTANYDATLIGWATLDPGETQIPSNITFSGGNSKFCNSIFERGELINNYNWTITDGGQDGSCQPNDPSLFVTTWKTDNPGVPSSNTSIFINTLGGGYNYDVDWGDGQVTFGHTGDALHDYGTVGTYTVRIRGSFPEIHFEAYFKLLSVDQWGTMVWTSMQDAFSGCSNLQINATDAPDLSNVTSTRGMFYDCSFSSIGNLNSWDVSHVTNMSFMFAECESFNQPLDSWNVSNVTNMSYMFWYCESFNQPLDSWNVSNVTNMSQMFRGTQFNQSLASWDVSSVTNMSQMFRGSSFNQPLGNWDISSVTNMSDMFDYIVTLSTTNYDATLIGWATLDPGETQIPSNITFSGGNSKFCNSVNERGELINNYNWTITDGGIDPGCDIVDHFVTTWQTDNPGNSGPTSITIQTVVATYNYDVDWDNDGVFDEFGITGSVTHDFGVPGTYTIRIRGNFPVLNFYFSGDREKLVAVNQWGNIAWSTLENAFRSCSNLEILATDAPNLSGITSLRSMFEDCTSLNQDINHWDVSTVSNMESLFRGATAFNQPLNNWDVSNVNNMGIMFKDAVSFDQDLGSWNVANVTYMGFMFEGAGLSVANYDQLLTGWSALPLQANVPFSAGSTQYCNGAPGRRILFEDLNWTITDGGYDFSCNPAAHFVSTWNTSNPGSSGSNQLRIKPGLGTNFNFSVDWGDGNVDHGLDFSGMTHTYASPGIYEVRIQGSYHVIGFGGPFAPDAPKLISVDQWGSIAWSSMSTAFLGCNNLTALPATPPDLAGITDLSGMFEDCTSFNVDISNWDVSQVTNMDAMLRNTPFNQPLNSWNVGNVTDMSNMFRENNAFNQPLNNWNVSQVTNMTAMFREATSFNQDLGQWDVSNVTDMTLMFNGAELSRTNYDNLLIGWNALPLQPNVNFNGGYSKYCLGASARQNMINNLGWTIIDGGPCNQQPPVAICQNVSVSADANCQAAVAAQAVDNGSYDPEGAMLNYSLSPAWPYALGATTVTLTAADDYGFTGTCTATVTVTDPLAPTFTHCPANQIVDSQGGQCGAIVTFTAPAAIDNCGIPTITQTAGITNSGFFPVGATDQTYVAMDATGNSATCSFTVTVVDTEAPVISICPTHPDVNLGNNCEALLPDLTLIVVFNDNCNDQAVVSQMPEPGTPVGPGAYTLVLTVTDAAGNSDNCSATVVVADNTLPQCTGEDIFVSTEPGQCTAVVTYTIPTAVDNCPGAVIELTSGLGSGSAFPKGLNEEVYTVTDAAGNTNECYIGIVVNDGEGPTALCQDITVSVDVNGNAQITPQQIDNSSSDNCSNLTLSASPLSFDCSQLGPNTVTLSVFDGQNPPSTCEAIVTIVDEAPPIARCQDATIELDENNYASISLEDINDNSFDACSSVSLALSQTEFDCDNSGANTVTLYVTDINGNTSSCTANVTVDDVTPPVITCKDITVQLNANGEYFLSNHEVEATAYDNCGLGGGLVVPTQVTCADAGQTITVEVTRIDNSPNDNQATCFSQVTVLGGPVALCRDLTVQLDANGQASITIAQINDGSYGTCSPLAGLSLDRYFLDCFPLGPRTVTLTAIDSESRTSTCEATVTVEDNIPPVAACENITVELGDDGIAYVSPSQVGDNTADNCQEVGISLSQTVFDCSHLGNNTVTLMATDGPNNSTCTAIVTVVETPTAACKDITVFLDATGQASVSAASLDDGSFASCGGALTFSFEDGSTQLDFDCGDVNTTSYYILVVTGPSGNTSTCFSQVSVRDDIAPTANCKNVTIELDASGTATYADDIINDGSTDNCGSVSVQTQMVIVTCADIGSFDATFTATDASGNSSSCTGTITVVDNAGPTAVCQNISVELDANGSATITPEQINNGSFDNCGIASMALSETEMVCSYTYFGNRQVTLTVTDLSGNTSTCTANVGVQDNIPATAVCQDITVYLDDNGQATVDAQDVGGGSYDNCLVDYFDLSQTTFDCSKVGANPVTLFVADPGGGGSSCNAVITIVDNTPPVMACQDITATLDDNGEFALYNALFEIEVTDNCGVSGGAVVPNVVTCAQAGQAIAVTVYRYDVNNNLGSCTANVTVVDADAPAFTDCPGDQTFANLDGQCGAFVEYTTPSVSDNCGIPTLTQTEGISNPGFFPVGSTTQTYVAVDATGNSATCSFTITITDEEAPAISCPADIDVVASSAAGAVANYTAPVGTDNCGAATVQTAGLASGATFPVGVTANTFVATDEAGNSAACSFTVTVVGVAPEIVCPATITVNNTPGQCDAPVNFEATETVGIPESTITYSHTPGSTFAVGTTMVTATASNTVGNSSCTFEVRVVDNIAPAALCQDVTVQLNANGAGSINPDEVDFGSTDACGVQSTVLSEQSYSCADVGNSNTVILTVTDNNGNVSSCTATVTVEDKVAPVAVCQDITVGLNDVGAVTVTPQLIDGGSSDACGIYNTTIDVRDFDCSSVGVHTATLTVTDVNGNASTCSATVTVEDLIPPAISCPDNIVVGNDSGNCGAVADYDAATATDNCSGAIVTLASGLGSGATFPIGLTTEHYTVTDASGNQASCSFTVTVNKTGDPSLLYAYTVIGFKEVVMKENTVQSGGVGVVNAGKKAKLKGGTMVTAPNTFVKAPVLDIDGSSHVTNYFTGQVDINLLPPFLSGDACNNDLDIPDNSGPVFLSLDCYGEIKVGKNASITFLGQATVNIEKLELKDGASVFFGQPTNLLIEKEFKGGKDMLLSNEGHEVWIFAEKDVTIEGHSEVTANIYTLDKLVVKKSNDFPTTMTGLFISEDKVDSKENVIWNWSPDCDLVDPPSGNNLAVSSNGTNEMIGQQQRPVEETTTALDVFPNPFTTQANIRYFLPEASEAVLEVFNLAGQLVWRYDAGLLDAGSYDYSWNGAAANGHPLDAGLYLVRLRVGDSVLVKRVSLAR